MYSAAAVEGQGRGVCAWRFFHCATETPGRVHPGASSRDLRLWLDVGLAAQNASSVVRKHLPRRQLNSVERKNFFKMNYFRGKKSPIPSVCPAVEIGTFVRARSGATLAIDLPYLRRRSLGLAIHQLRRYSRLRRNDTSLAISPSIAGRSYPF